MDESQSSDFFSETDISYNNSMIMDSVPYEILIVNTKLALSNGSRKEIKKTTFLAYCTSLLEDCRSCISQALDCIISILSDRDIEISKVIEYMNDAVSLLQMLSDFIKTVIESVSMVCQNMKTFPTATCDIILKIFMHCKDSEYLYGPFISNVERELKELFCTCHELQLTYLMVMEKHFVFDVTEKEDVEILTDALEINLKIGDIVQTLDVKTMAEQWKAFTAICEKHSNVLMDKNIYNNSLSILSDMIENNIKTALERNQEDKVILRALKVTSFSIKILLKICSIFKHATLKNHKGELDLLVSVYSNNSAILEILERDVQLLNLMNMNVSHPAEQLLKELLSDIKFVNYVLDYDMNNLQSDDKLLGYILIVVSTIKCTLQIDDNQCFPKQKLINVTYGIFHHCHAYMKMGLKFPTEIKSTYETHGLYEHLLTSFVAFAATLSGEVFAVLERRMIDSILGSDCMGALFSVNTWTLLARIMTPHLLLNQLTSLCRLYQKLDRNKLFFHSPQKVYLSYTVGCLFGTMQNEDKLKLFKLFNMCDEKNYNLWCSLHINNLPDDLKVEAEDIVTQRLKMQLRKKSAGADSGEVEKTIKIFNLAATCPEKNKYIVDFLPKTWGKACPKNYSVTMGIVSKETLWYLNYVSALASVTVNNHDVLQSVHLIKILHVIAEIIKTGSTELKLLVVNIVCKFVSLVVDDNDKYIIESLLIHSLKYLSQDAQNSIKYKLYSSLRRLKSCPNLHRIISAIIKEDHSQKQIWDCFLKYGLLCKNNKWREQLLLKGYNYRHKCIGTNDSEPRQASLKNTCSGNFELVDIDELFDNDSDSEQPVNKKLKLNYNEADSIISRLENDADLLCKLKNITSEQKMKIRCLYDQLRNICD